MPSNSRLKATARSYKLVLISHANERERGVSCRRFGEDCVDRTYNLCSQQDGKYPDRMGKEAWLEINYPLPDPLSRTALVLVDRL
jgi:hypothetical protein